MARRLQPSSLWISDDHDVEHHGAAILLLVRNGIARGWEDLCRVLRFDRDRRAFHSGHLALKGTIEDLIDSELLESKVGHTGSYRVTDKALRVIGALGLSLTQAANMPYHSGMAVRPTFGKPKRLDHVPHVFMIMPFRRELRHVYDGSVKSACRALRFSVQRADDIFSAGDLLSGIWEGIVNAFVIVADCTAKNPNVFYELGIAHTLGSRSSSSHSGMKMCPWMSDTCATSGTQQPRPVCASWRGACARHFGR